MKEQQKLIHCRGCRDDFYNGKNPMNVQRCWMLKSARLVTRYRIGTWTQPTEPFAFTKMKVFNCYNEKGAHFFEELPNFVKPSQVAGK